MKYLKWALILVAVLVVAYVGYKVYERINRDFSDWEAEVADKEARIDSLKAAADKQVEDFLEREEAWQAQRSQDSATIAALTVEVDDASAVADSLGVELREKLPLKFRAQFDQLIAAHQRQVRAILTRETVKDRRIRHLENQHTQDVGDYFELNRTLRAALAESQELTEFWKGKARRHWYEKWQVIAPVTIGLTLGGVALLSQTVN